MTRARLVELRELEGHEISLALSQGRRIDGASLVSAGRGNTNTVWVYVEGADEFVPATDIVDFFEYRPRLVS